MLYTLGNSACTWDAGGGFEFLQLRVLNDLLRCDVENGHVVSHSFPSGEE